MDVGVMPFGVALAFEELRALGATVIDPADPPSLAPTVPFGRDALAVSGALGQVPEIVDGHGYAAWLSSQVSTSTARYRRWRPTLMARGPVR